MMFDFIFNFYRTRLTKTIPFAKSRLNKKEDDEAYKIVVDTIKLHTRVIEFADVLESSYSVSFLVLVAMIVVFCCTVCVLVRNCLFNKQYNLTLAD